MSRTSTLHAAAAALGVLAGFALAPDGAPPLDRDVTPYAVAVAWNTPAPPVQVVRIHHADEAASTEVTAFHWTPGPRADPAPHAHPHPATGRAEGGGSSQAPGVPELAEEADAVVPAAARACPERSRGAAARLRQS